jgi:hypothetical protein
VARLPIYTATTFSTANLHQDTKLFFYTTKWETLTLYLQNFRLLTGLTNYGIHVSCEPTQFYHSYPGNRPADDVGITLQPSPAHLHTYVPAIDVTIIPLVSAVETRHPVNPYNQYAEQAQRFTGLPREKFQGRRHGPTANLNQATSHSSLFTIDPFEALFFANRLLYDPPPDKHLGKSRTISRQTQLTKYSQIYNLLPFLSIANSKYDAITPFTLIALQYPWNNGPPKNHRDLSQALRFTFFLRAVAGNSTSTYYYVLGQPQDLPPLVGNWRFFRHVESCADDPPMIPDR